MSSRRSTRFAFVLALALVGLPLHLSAAPPQPTCNGNESLTGSDTFPFNDSLSAPLTDDFDMTASGCIEEGVDHVTCFRPTNNCSVNITCSYPGGSPAIGANLYAGGCDTSPSSCSTASGGPGSTTIFGFALTGGTDYCVVCESDANITQLDISISEVSGNCGALPVTLESFTIER